MKLMINGGITLGTLDGANVEIYNLVGDDNMEIFGMRTEEVNDLKNSGRYLSWDEYNADRGRLGRIVDELTDGTFANLSGNFEEIHDQIMMHNDENFVLRDFKPYVDGWNKLVGIYSRYPQEWNRMSLHNTAKAGYFSSDRTIAEYARDIWHVE